MVCGQTSSGCGREGAPSAPAFLPGHGCPGRDCRKPGGPGTGTTPDAPEEILEGQRCALSQDDTGRCTSSHRGRRPRPRVTQDSGVGIRHGGCSVREKGAPRAAGGLQAQRAAGHVGAGALRAPGGESLGEEGREPPGVCVGCRRGAGCPVRDGGGEDE